MALPSSAGAEGTNTLLKPCICSRNPVISPLQVVAICTGAPAGM
ncbi:hypothetical protein BIWAKO_02906 [Bosea sp. BIWAKO-01]|nr:hypothetical protein BIWAKO_02906 [Bosea sp. BIWAKO-01]